MAHYLIYTDGSYLVAKKKGAYSYIILDVHKNEIKRDAQLVINETSNRAEIMAIVVGINNLPADATDCTVISDSQYALNVCQGLWQRNANLDLLELHDKIVYERQLGVTYQWVRGHNGNFYNELCDALCNEVLGVTLKIRDRYDGKRKKGNMTQPKFLPPFKLWKNFADERPKVGDHIFIYDPDNAYFYKFIFAIYDGNLEIFHSSIDQLVSVSENAKWLNPDDLLKLK